MTLIVSTPVTRTGPPAPMACLVMGVLDVTPDSFPDGGAHAAPAEAISAWAVRAGACRFRAHDVRSSLDAFPAAIMEVRWQHSAETRRVAPPAP